MREQDVRATGFNGSPKGSLNAVVPYSGTERELTRVLDTPLKNIGIKPRKLSHRIRSHTAAVTGLDLNDDEDLVYASSRSGAVLVFDREKGECVDQFRGTHDWWLADIAVGNGVIASAGADGRVVLWNADGRCLDVLRHSDIVTGVAFNCTRTLLASSSQDKTVRVWRISKSGQGCLLTTFRGHQASVLSVCFAGESSLVSAGIGGAILWDAITGETLGYFKPLPPITATVTTQAPFDLVRDHRVSVLKVHCRGEFVLGACSDKRARIWNLDGRLLRVAHGIGGAAFSVQIDADCRTIAIGWENDAIVVSDLFDGHRGFWLGKHTDWPLDLAFTRDGRLISGGLDSKILEADLDMKRTVASYAGMTRSVCDADLQGSSLAVGGHDNAVSIYDITTGRQTQRFTRLTHWVNAVSLSPCGRFVAGGTRNGDAVLILRKTGELHSQLTSQTSEVASMAFSRDGNRLLVGTKHGHADLYDTSTGRTIRKYPLTSHMVHYVEWLSHEAEFIAACWNGRTYRVSVVSEEISATYEGGDTEAGVEAAQVSDDLGNLVTVAFDGLVRIFDFHAGGRPMASFRAHPGRIRSMAMRSGILATGGLDATIKVWDWRLKRLLHTIRDCGDSITALHFTADGDRLVAGSRDGTVRFFSCPKDYEMLAVLYSLDGGGCLWESPDGWFYSDRADETIEIFECDEDGQNRTPLSQEDPRRQSYVSTHNDFSRIEARILGDDFQGRAERFDKLVAYHQAAGRTRRLLEEHCKDGVSKTQNTSEEHRR